MFCRHVQIAQASIVHYSKVLSASACSESAFKDAVACVRDNPAVLQHLPPEVVCHTGHSTR